MATVSFDRRSFLATSSVAAIAITLGGCADPNGISPEQQRLLQRMAYRLYPHDSLPESEYRAAIAPLISAASSDPALAELVGQGAVSLNEQSDGDWLSADDTRQIEALRQLEQSAFFAEVQNFARPKLYDQPAVWEVVGYEGPSLEFGGYLERGFDDIDWLGGV